MSMNLIVEISKPGLLIRLIPGCLEEGMIKGKIEKGLSDDKLQAYFSDVKVNDVKIKKGGGNMRVTVELENVNLSQIVDSVIENANMKEEVAAILKAINDTTDEQAKLDLLKMLLNWAVTNKLPDSIIGVLGKDNKMLKDIHIAGLDIEN